MQNVLISEIIFFKLHKLSIAANTEETGLDSKIFLGF